MKRVKLLIILALFTSVLSIAVGRPMTGEDDEYDDDPEFPERKVLMVKLQEELEKQHQAEYLATSTSSTTTTPKPHRPPPVLKQKRKWVLARDVHGYQVLSDGPRIETELIRTRPMLRIRVDIPETIRAVEKTFNRRHVELKIRNWDKVYKVHVKVPFGYQPEDLRIVEMKDHIDIIAPIYSEVDKRASRYK